VQLALRNIETWLGATLIPTGSPVLLAIEARLGTEARLLDAIQRAIGGGYQVSHTMSLPRLRSRRLALDLLARRPKASAPEPA
jgi:hypothetical protein